MQDIMKIFIGILVLFLGIPIGNLLARFTEDELKQGQKWFGILIVFCLFGAVISLSFRNDFFLFSFLFVGVVTSRSLKR